MGVFTMYCAVCGCPLMDISHWVRGRKAPFCRDEEEVLKNFDFEMREGKWLNEVCVITKHRKSGISVSSGSCDDYGVVRIYDEEDRVTCTYTVCPLNFGRDANDGIDGDGFGIHKICYNLLHRLWPEKKAPTNHELFEYLEKEIDEMLGTLGIDYGGIEENWEQDYDLKDGEDHFVKPPVIPLVTDHSKPLEIGDLLKSMGYFYKIPFEVIIESMKFLEVQDLCRLSKVSRFFYNYSRKDIFWKPLFEKEFLIIDEKEDTEGNRISREGNIGRRTRNMSKKKKEDKKLIEEGEITYKAYYRECLNSKNMKNLKRIKKCIIQIHEKFKEIIKKE